MFLFYQIFNLIGSSKDIARAWAGGARAIPKLFLAAYFALRNTKLAAAKIARTGREFIFPTPLFLPAPSERISEALGRA
ncbi:MAG: hypothetical protein A2915_04360 [Candidatus Yanofskybacteria bacterium RIFCSPLOWO2_01_FULL_41_34]|uniref:Uncharacterized protein n=1 Tax=Candidatus Yanofskybacteria bacterium RIFCSPHIGHO2_01_FULL_41_26 TaxID=1802661 RepID=A0A1F8EBS0_9BACT|nr:MAG: hypothetical protein A2649_03460 [Candidatus Yanofskybacteria bacterium RIFCSPHIGHO2_01_FULL_41_26]OGN21636.1 MAG: hypothetical protein A2915_04360 [Candidatus Yanofskybacteria bacterium RIFCSPLOWO2_01_FULL_41_34]